MATASITLGLNSSPLVQGLARARGQVRAFGANVQGMFATFSRGAMGPMAGIFSGAAFAGGITSSVRMGARLHNLSKQTGIAAGEVYELTGAFEENDMTADDVATSIARMQKAISGGSKNFQEFTVSVAELERLRPSQQFQAIARDIMAVEDPTKRTALAMQIFGRSGASLIPVFQDVARMDLSQLSKGAEFIGKNAEGFDRLDDAITKARRSRDLFFAGFTSKVADAVTGAAEGASDADTLKAGEDLADNLKWALDSVGTSFKQKFLQDVKDIARVAGPILSLLPKGVSNYLKQQGGLATEILGLNDSGQQATPAPAAAKSPWGRLSGFKSFRAPDVAGNAESIRNSNYFSEFFGAGGAPGAYKPMGEILGRKDASMTGAYGQSDIRGPKWRERAEKDNKPATKEDIDSVMGKYWR